MPSRDVADRAQVCVLARLGWSKTDIAREQRCSMRFVRKWYSGDLHLASLVDAPRSGRPPKATKAVCAKVRRMIENKRYTGTRKIAEALQRQGTDISRRTVQRIAQAAPLAPSDLAQAQAPRGNKLKRRRFAKEFNDTDWTTFWFADEKRFCFEHPNRQNDVIWCAPGVSPPQLETVNGGARINASPPGARRSTCSPRTSLLQCSSTSCSVPCRDRSSRPLGVCARQRSGASREGYAGLA